MKTQQRSFLFLILLGTASLLLPACGGGNNVKSQKAPETVLNSEPSDPEEVSASDEDSSDSYVSSIKTKKNSASSDTASSDASATDAVPAEAPSSSQTPAMESTAAPKKGSNWLWWVLLGFVLLGAAYLAWKKRQSEDHSAQPMPPVGGLSPVSGFTALKGRIEEDPSEGTSFWSKKLF